MFLLTLVLLGTFGSITSTSIESFQPLVLYTEKNFQLIRNYWNVTENITDIRNCLHDFFAVSAGLLQGDEWAFEMVDATVSIQSGLMEGHMYEFGNFDECMDLESDDGVIRGRYCLMGCAVPKLKKPVKQLRMHPEEPTKFEWTRGMCIPHRCEVRHIEELFRYLEEANNISVSTHVLNKTCEFKGQTDRTTVWDIPVIMILVFLVAWIGFCTLMDVAKPALNVVDPKLIQCFSLYRNAHYLYKMDSSSNSIKCLDGIRVLSILWIMLAHRMFIMAFVPTSINHKWFVILFQTYFSTLLTAGPIAVDTFLLISGYLVTSALLKLYKKTFPPENKMTVKEGVLFWIYYGLHRYMRLSIGLFVLVIFSLTLSRSLSEAPLWDLLVDKLIWSKCEKNWWATLLYVQNYVNTEEMCLDHSWYLAVDLQLYLLAPILILLLFKFNNRAYSIYFILIILAHVILGTILTTYEIKVPAALMLPVAQSDVVAYNTKYYSKAHCRAIPWIFGSMLAYRKFINNQIPKWISKVTAALLWIGSFVMMASVILSIHAFVHEDYQYHIYKDTVYLIFSKTAWSMSLCWIIYACENGYGGVLNWFLSMRIFTPLCRLSYGMYMMSMVQQFLSAINDHTGKYFSFQTTMYLFFGDILITMFWASALYLIFEGPIYSLEKTYLRQRFIQEEAEMISIKPKEDEEDQLLTKTEGLETPDEAQSLDIEEKIISDTIEVKVDVEIEQPGSSDAAETVDNVQNGEEKSLTPKKGEHDIQNASPV